MTRTVPEWVGKTSDTAIPPRVKLRVFKAYGGKCANCKVKLGGANPPEYDHISAIANGGANTETNLQPLCRNCHKPKTARDVAQKSKDARIRAKHLGIAPKKSRFATSRDGPWKAKVGGGLVKRT